MIKLFPGKNGSCAKGFPCKHYSNKSLEKVSATCRVISMRTFDKAAIKDFGADRCVGDHAIGGFELARV